MKALIPTNIKITEFLSHETARCDSFKFLSECFAVPSQVLYSTLRDLLRRMEEICTQAAPYVNRMSQELEDLYGIEELTIDYARLFVGPYELLAAPYGSVYLETRRRVMGESTIDVQNFYRDVGLDVSKDFHEAPDHIMAELEFMHFLIFKEIQALSIFDSELAIDYIKRQESFLEHHLTAWVAEFADNIDKNSQTEFYRSLGRCTRVFVLNDHCHLMKSFGGAISLHGADCEESKTEVI
jgi:TorA maturation chaperone TorD